MSTLADGVTTSSTVSRDPPPVLIKWSNHSEVQSNVNPNICIVDNASKITPEKRKQLIPKMKLLRDAGLFAYILFSPIARLVYKQGHDWCTIFPEQQLYKFQHSYFSYKNQFIPKKSYSILSTRSCNICCI